MCTNPPLGRVSTRALSALGVEPIAFGETEPSIHPAPQQFFSVWRLPDAEAQAALLSGIAATGWHDYFDTVNAAGKGVGAIGWMPGMHGVYSAAHFPTLTFTPPCV